MDFQKFLKDVILLLNLDFSALGLKDLPFSDIALSVTDALRLRRCAGRRIPELENDRLLCYGFAKQVTACTGGSTMPKPNGYISITPRGLAYLDYSRRETRRYLMPQLLSLLAVAVSFLSLYMDITAP